MATANFTTKPLVRLVLLLCYVEEELKFGPQVGR